MIEYKCLDRGVEVDRPSEHGTSSNCSNCGHANGSDRLERGLWKCSSCGTVIHDDVNDADNLRQKPITMTPPLAQRLSGEGNSGTGSVALPTGYLNDRTRGFLPRNSVVDREPELLIQFYQSLPMRLVGQEAHGFSRGRMSHIVINSSYWGYFLDYESIVENILHQIMISHFNSKKEGTHIRG